METFDRSQLRSADRGADVPRTSGTRESTGRIQNPPVSGWLDTWFAIPAPPSAIGGPRAALTTISSPSGIVGISHIDTRKLVRHLRSAGVMRAGIFSGDALLDDEGRLKTVARAHRRGQGHPADEGSEPVRRGQHQGDVYGRAVWRVRGQGAALHPSPPWISESRA